MLVRSFFKLLMLAVAGMLLSTSYTSAQSCTGTLVLASSDESTGPGQIMGGTYLDTQASNNIREAFSETVSGGVSKLYHQWSFPNVPAGSISIIREGYRLSTPDGDNFRFRGWKDTEEGPVFYFGSICTINSETEASQKCSLSDTTTETLDFHFYIEDTNHTSGTDLTAVAVDYLAICSE